MAAGERNINGRATDIVIHFLENIKASSPICKQKIWWNASTSIE
jgi:hypothetical protein